MQEPKIIVAGYISLDITPSFPQDAGNRRSLSDWIQPGKLVNVGRATVSPGGCVTNTGAALHVLGADVTLMAKIGSDDFGRQILQHYADMGVRQKIHISEDETTSYTIAIAPPGCDRCFLADSASNHTFCADDLDREELAKAQYFHFGYPQIMRSFYQNDGEALCEMYRKVKEMGLVTSMDAVAIDPTGDAAKADWKLILRRTLPYVDFFVPSAEELCFMLDRERYDAWQKKSDGDDVCMHLSLSEDVVPLAKEALSLGCRAILLKCGAAGMYLATQDEETMRGIAPFFDATGWGNLSVFQDSYKPDRIRSGTGAGDTAIAAFLYGLSHGKKPQDCLAIAAGSGACCITEYDSLSGLLPIPELEKKIAAGWEKQHFIGA